MKTTIKILSVSALLVLAGCSTENTTPDVKPTRNIVVNAGSVNTKVNFTDNGVDKVEVKWNNENEAFSAFIGTGAGAAVVPFSQLSAPDAAGSVKFSGDIPAETAGETMVYAVYPKQNVTAGNPAAVSLVLGEEYGIMDETKTFMYAASTLDDMEDKSKALKFNHLTSIVKVTLDFGAEVSGEVTDVVFTAAELIRTATIDLTSETPVITPLKKGYIPVSGNFEIEEGKAIVYLHILPSTLADLKISAKVGEETYSATLAGRTVAAGRLYNTTATMAVAGVKKFTDVILRMQTNTGGSTHFLSTVDGKIYDKTTATANSSSIDIISYYSASGNTMGYGLCSPDTGNASTVYGKDFMVSWAARNTTRFKRLSGTLPTADEYAAISKASELEKIYTTSTVAEAATANSLNLEEKRYVAFKTAAGKYGLLLVTYRTGTNTKTGLIKVNYIIAE